jgi:hypothetical protein
VHVIVGARQRFARAVARRGAGFVEARASGVEALADVFAQRGRVGLRAFADRRFEFGEQVPQFAGNVLRRVPAMARDSPRVAAGLCPGFSPNARSSARRE